jgi:RimJ/RimL family protein N-acetyltransferase
VIRIITGADAELGQWIGERLGMALGAGAALGFAEHGRLVGAIHYTNFTQPWATTEMSIYAASPHWATRRTLHAAFSYPFLQIGSRRVGATIAAENRHAREFVERVGFRLEGVARNAWQSGDACIYGMTRLECRWLAAAPPAVDSIDFLLPPLTPLEALVRRPEGSGEAEPRPAELSQRAA